MATKASLEAEVFKIVDDALLKRKRGCLDDVRRWEEALSLQNEIFRNTFNVGSNALRRQKAAKKTLALAQGRSEGVKAHLLFRLF